MNYDAEKTCFKKVCVKTFRVKKVLVKKSVFQKRGPRILFNKYLIWGEDVENEGKKFGVGHAADVPMQFHQNDHFDVLNKIFIPGISE